MRTDFVIFGERYGVRGTCFGAADKVGEVVLKIDDGIVDEQQSRNAVEFHEIVAAIGDVLEEPAPHAEIEPVIFGEVKLDPVVIQELHCLCRKRAVVREQYDGKVGLGEVLQRKLHIPRKIFPGLVACVENNFTVAGHN